METHSIRAIRVLHRQPTYSARLGRGRPCDSDMGLGCDLLHRSSDSADPPSIITLVSKLTGDGAARVLSYAPGELRNMADFEGDQGPR